MKKAYNIFSFNTDIALIVWDSRIFTTEEEALNEVKRILATRHYDNHFVVLPIYYYENI